MSSQEKNNNNNKKGLNHPEDGLNNINTQDLQHKKNKIMREIHNFDSLTIHDVYRMFIDLSEPEKQKVNDLGSERVWSIRRWSPPEKSCILKTIGLGLFAAGLSLYPMSKIIARNMRRARAGADKAEGTLVGSFCMFAGATCLSLQYYQAVTRIGLRRHIIEQHVDIFDEKELEQL